MSLSIGNHYENLALNYLKARGLSLVVRNYRSRYGEIDLIMQDKNYLVFVEVRYRQSQQYGSSIESINHIKQQKLIKTAQYYLLKHPQNRPCRFDVIGINQQSLTWIKNAF
jgi:putative endonuclease